MMCVSLLIAYYKRVFHTTGYIIIQFVIIVNEEYTIYKYSTAP